MTRSFLVLSKVPQRSTRNDLVIYVASKIHLLYPMMSFFMIGHILPVERDKPYFKES